MGQPLEGLKCKAKTNSSGEAVTGLQGDMIMTSREDHFLLALWQTWMDSGHVYNWTASHWQCL